MAVSCSREAPSALERRSTGAVIEPGPNATSTVAPAPRAPSARDDAPPMATVTLLDSGTAPRVQMRYEWRADQAEQLTMDLRTSASSSRPVAPEQATVPLPAVHVVVAINPKEVFANGDLSYAWHVTMATISADAATPHPVVSGMRAEVTAVEHLAGTAVVTARGLARAVAIDPMTMADAGATGQMVEQIRQTLRDIAVPLPEEDVGLGARWQKQSQLDTRETPITQTETFTLRAFRHNQGTLDDVLAQSAPPQTLHAPGMAPAAQARMESMLSSGEATVSFELSRLVPQTTFDGTTTMVVSGRLASDSARRLTMVLHVGIVIAGAKR